MNAKDQVFLKILGGVGGAAALFCALGYTVVQSYVYRNGFEGIFWFTNQFYRDAGASFLLDLIRVPILAPFIFFPYFFLLYWLMPKEEELHLFKKQGVPVSSAHWIKVLALLLIMIITGIIALYYDSILGKKFVARLIDLLRRSSEHMAAQPEQSLAFCCLVTPVIAVFSIFLIKHWKGMMPGYKGREFYCVLLVFYLLFLFIIPVTYGCYLYDIRIVPLKNPELVRSGTTLSQDIKDDEIWLLGQFDDKYIFFKKQKNTLSTQGIIETYNVDEIKHLNFDIRHASTLKIHMQDYVPETLREKTTDWMLNDFVK